MRVSGYEQFQLNQYHLDQIQGQMSMKSQQISTGKAFFNVSDDPVKVDSSMLIGVTENKVNQFQSNITDAKGLLQFIDTNFGNTVTSMQQAQQDALRAANGSYSQTDKDQVADEIEQTIQQVVGYANSKYLNRYVFSGEKTDTQPITYNGTTVTYNGNSNKMKVNVSDQISADVSQDGGSVFVPMLTELINLRDQLRTGTDASITTSMTNLDTLMNDFINNRSKVGVQLQSLDTLNTAYSQTKADLEAKKQNIEDADLSKVVTDYTYLQTRYQASIQAQVKMSANTILNYL